VVPDELDDVGYGLRVIVEYYGYSDSGRLLLALML